MPWNGSDSRVTCAGVAAITTSVVIRPIIGRPAPADRVPPIALIAVCAALRLAQSLQRPFPERVGQPLAVPVGAEMADGREVQQRREQAGARLGGEAARGVRDARAVGGELARQVRGIAPRVAVCCQRGAQRAAGAAKGPVGARAIVVVQRGGRLGGAPAGHRERVTRVDRQPQPGRERVDRAHEQADALDRIGRGWQQRARELAVGLEDVVHGAELPGPEPTELRAIVVDLDARHGRVGARAGEAVAQPALERVRRVAARRLHAHAQVVPAAGSVDVALEEPAIDLARVLAGADRRQQPPEQVVLPSLRAEQLERPPAFEAGARAPAAAPRPPIESGRRAARVPRCRAHRDPRSASPPLPDGGRPGRRSRPAGARSRTRVRDRRDRPRRWAPSDRRAAARRRRRPARGEGPPRPGASGGSRRACARRRAAASWRARSRSRRGRAAE